MFKKKFFLSFAFSLTGFYVVSAKASFYQEYPRFDVPMHFLGGMAAAIFFAIFFRRELNGLNPFLIAVFLLSATVTAGVVWEFFEWALDHFLLPYYSGMRRSQFGLNDTLGDLFVDLVGGLVVIISFLFQSKNKKE